MNLIGKHVTTAFFVIIVVTAGSGIAQTGGGRTLTCYSARTGQRIPCPSAPQPAQPPPPPSSTNPAPDDSARIEAERRAAEEQRRREDAARAEAERQRLERERQEKFERDKQETLNSLKDNTGSANQLKGGSPTDLQLKSGTTQDPGLKDSATDYTRVRRPTMVAAVRGGTSAVEDSELTRKFFEIIEAMDALTLKKGWNEEERQRFVDYVLGAILEDGSPELEKLRTNEKALAKLWIEIKKRDSYALLVNPRLMKGTYLYKESWKQTGNTCTLHALAAASGRPYWEVEQIARNLISEATWRTADERVDPGSVMKTGLRGLELAYVAESLGKIRAVKLSDFASTIAAGRPLMVHLVPSTGKTDQGHQVVLARTFKLRGKTWYEVIDSNQQKSWARRYVTHEELSGLIKENAMAFDPEPVTKPLPLK